MSERQVFQIMDAGQVRPGDIEGLVLVDLDTCKRLDKEEPGHGLRAETARQNVVEAFLGERFGYYAMLQTYLNRIGLGLSSNEKEDWGFLRNSGTPMGVVFLGTPASGKSSCAYYLSQRVPCSFYLGKGEEPGRSQESLLTFTYRDRLMTREEFARLGRDTQDEALDSLISFGRSKVHER
ncbi:MAG: hypothetical protein U9Q67_05010, partial [Patescibacteria group bacterium]|nr:hypothetical protein [Patescibacteria group bacterium]